MPAKSKLSHYPVLLGIIIGTMMAASTFVVGTWFPRLAEVFARDTILVDGVFFTGGLYGTWVYLLWDWRTRSAFWESMSILLLLHILSVYVYSTYVHPLGLRQWSLLLFAESFVIAFGVDWSTRRFGHLGKHGPRRFPF
jgi:hypothetical protein